MNESIIPDSVSRRQFLKTAALGSLGALILQQQAQAYSLGDNARIITILGLVDITQSLADGDVTNNVYWFDNNRILGSQNEGTNVLSSKVKDGDIINWVVVGLEVETMVTIHKIEGSVIPIAAPAPDPTSPISAWKGVVDTNLSGSFPYSISLLVEDIIMPMTTALTLEL